MEKTPPEKICQRATGGFCSLVAVRGLTVLNGCLIFWLVIGLGKRAVVSAGMASTPVLTLFAFAFVLPFILFAWLASQLANRFAKRTIVIRSKFAEVLIGTAAVIVVALGTVTEPTLANITLAGIPFGLWWLISVVGLFGFQLALLNPSLLGTIPEIVPRSRLSVANGVFTMVSAAATLAGMILGKSLTDLVLFSPEQGSARLLPSWLSANPFGPAVPAAVGMLAVAVIGYFVSRQLPKMTAADPQHPVTRNAVSKTVFELRQLLACREVAGPAVGIVFFWGLAAVVQLIVVQFASDSGAITHLEGGLLLLASVCGFGVGSLMAGWLSREGIDSGSSVNLGLLPVGGLIIAVACVALALSGERIFVGGILLSSGVVGAISWLFLLGIGAGMFDVPLEAYLQEQSPPCRLGSILATTNLMVFTGILTSLIVYCCLCMPISEGDVVRPLLSARGCFSIVAGMAVLATITSILAAPRPSLRLFVDSLIRTICRFRISQAELLPTTGPVVVIANHISWLDGFLVVLASRRPVRMVVYGPNIRGRFLNRLAAQWRFILFEPKTKSIARALKTMRSGLREGDVIGIFCEGGISRTGQILGFKRGLGHILDRVEAPMIPLAIDGLWGSIFSFSEGLFFWKWPRGWTRPVTMKFGKPLPVGVSPTLARLALQETTAEAVQMRFECLGDAAAAAATAEAIHGCCLLSRQDRLVSSLSANDPLSPFITVDSFRQLGVTVRELGGELPGEELLEAITRHGATVWLARPDQLRAVAAVARSAESKLPDVVVVPISVAADLAVVQPALTVFKAEFGVQPVVAYAPPGCGLVAMNSPLSRTRGQQVTCKPDTVGRVVNGAVVWPRAAFRAEAARGPLVGERGEDSGSSSLVIAATIPAGSGPGWRTLPEQFDVDDDGFLQLRLDQQEEGCIVEAIKHP